MTSEARFFANMVVLSLAYGGMVGVCVFAWVKGRPAERYGATVFLASSLIIVGLEIWTGQSVPVVPEVLLDTAVAVAFLVLAIRYNNLWLGAAMIIKGVQLAINGSHLTELDDVKFAGFDLYAALLNLISLLILLIFFAATLASVRARRRDGKVLARASASPMRLAGSRSG